MVRIVCPSACHTRISPKLSEIDLWLLWNVNRNWGFPIQNLPSDLRSEVRSGVLLNMEVGIRKRAWHTCIRYTLLIYDHCGEYTLFKKPGSWYTVYTLVYPPIHHWKYGSTIFGGYRRRLKMADSGGEWSSRGHIVLALGKDHDMGKPDWAGPVRLLSVLLYDGITLGTVAGQLSSRPIMDDNLSYKWCIM